MKFSSSCQKCWDRGAKIIWSKDFFWVKSLLAWCFAQSRGRLSSFGANQGGKSRFSLKCYHQKLQITSKNSEENDTTKFIFPIALFSFRFLLFTITFHLEPTSGQKIKYLASGTGCKDISWLDKFKFFFRERILSGKRQSGFYHHDPITARPNFCWDRGPVWRTCLLPWALVAWWTVAKLQDMGSIPPLPQGSIRRFGKNWKLA